MYSNALLSIYIKQAGILKNTRECVYRQVRVQPRASRISQVFLKIHIQMHEEQAYFFFFKMFKKFPCGQTGADMKYIPCTFITQ